MVTIAGEGSLTAFDLSKTKLKHFRDDSTFSRYRINLFSSSYSSQSWIPENNDYTL